MRRWLRNGLVGGAVFAAALQVVPYGRDHANPPVTGEPAWPSDEVRQLAVDACFDCHSNETEWPVYSFVAPMSWLVQRDVDNGRAALNFSTWPRDDHQLEDAHDEVEDGDMPPRQYLLVHPEARLSARERALLAEAFEAMDEGGDGDNRGPGNGDDGDDGEGDDGEDRLEEDRRDEDRRGSDRGPG